MMNKKVCVITGANSGIGKAAAVQIAQQGHQVVMACRSRERGEAALQDVRRESGSDLAELMVLDMSSQASIRAFAAAFLAKYAVCDVLIHNAATFDIRQKARKVTDEGIESIWATNHVGPVLLTNLLLEALQRSEQGRVITISSKGLAVYPFLKVDLADPEFKQRKFSVQKAYYQSKLAQVMYTYWLAEELGKTAVTVNSIRVTNVKIDVDTRYAGMPKLARRLYSLKSKFSISPEKMAETYTYLALSPEVSQTTGAYFDDPKHIVTSSGYSRDKKNIQQVMDLTLTYLKT
jgi:NAD(P)-dependent dehydrogenase (short-subunit alcohol dehydrogenase family)